MKTFSIDKKLEDILIKLQHELKAESLEEVILKGINILSLINEAEKLEGSLYLENKLKERVPLELLKREVKTPKQRKKKVLR